MCVAGVGCALPSPRAAAPGTAARFRFDWQPPCRVPVTEHIDRDGQRAVYGYDVVLTATRDPELLEVRTDHFRPIEVNDLPSNRVGGVGERQMQIALAAALPVLRVARDGAFVDMLGEQELVERMLEMSGVAEGSPAASEMRRVLTSPLMMATLRERAGDTWRGWVGAWVGLTLAPGEALDGVEELPVPGGTLRAPVRYRRDELSSLSAQRARMTRIATLAGPEVEAFLASVLIGVGRATGRPFTADLVQSARRTTTMTADTDPATLRPDVTSFSTETELDVKGEAPRTQRQVRGTNFDWAHARGCGR